jgi:hypothetical protein
MIRTERLFSKRQRALKERLSVDKAALVGISDRQIAKRKGDVRMIRTERFFHHRKCAFVDRLGIGIATLQEIKQR